MTYNVFSGTLNPALSINQSCVCVVEQFYGQSRVYSDVLDYLNMIFTGVFTIEFILKLYAFRIKVSASWLAVQSADNMTTSFSRITCQWMSE